MMHPNVKKIHNSNAVAIEVIMNFSNPTAFYRSSTKLKAKEFFNYKQNFFHFFFNFTLVIDENGIY